MDLPGPLLRTAEIMLSSVQDCIASQLQNYFHQEKLRQPVCQNLSLQDYCRYNCATSFVS